MITAQGLIKLGFVPEVDFSLQDDKDGRGIYIAKWMTDAAQPSEAMIEQAHNEAQAEYDSNQYARDRATQYAPLADQLDMLWHAIDQGIDLKQSDFYTGNKAVKDANPKG